MTKTIIIKKNGLIEQWGTQKWSKTVGAHDNADGPRIVYSVLFTRLYPSVNITSLDAQQFNLTAVSYNLTGFTPRYRNINAETSAGAKGCFWTVVGW